MTHPDGEAPTSLLGAMLRGAALLSLRVSEIVSPYGLTLDRWRVLDLVGQQPGIAMNGVVGQLLIAPATATRTVDHLVSEGAIYRLVDPADRRRVVLRITARGQRLLELLSPQLGTLESVLRPGASLAEFGHLASTPVL